MICPHSVTLHPPFLLASTYFIITIITMSNHSIPGNLTCSCSTVWFIICFFVLAMVVAVGDDDVYKQSLHICCLYLGHRSPTETTDCCCRLEMLRITWNRVCNPHPVPSATAKLVRKMLRFSFNLFI